MELLANSSKKKKNINFRKEVRKYTKYWPWFILSLILCFVGAKLYLRYALPQYFTKATIKFEQTTPKANAQALNDLKNLGVGVSNEELEAETTVVISKPILKQVVDNLNLDVAYFVKGKIKEIEYYDDLPINAQIVNTKDPSKFSGATYTIIGEKNNQYLLVNAVSGKEIKGVWGQPLQLPWGTVVISNKPGFNNNNPIKIVFKNALNVVGSLEGAITVSIYKGLLMDLNMVGPIPKKSEAILNEVIKIYNQEGIKDKNQEAQFTANFIDRRLDIITNELSGIENQKEGVKREYQITDLAAQAQLALQNMNEGSKAILNQATELEIINAVYALSNANADKMLPTGIGLAEPIETLIGQYNDLLLTRNRTLKQATGANPAVIEMNKEIAALKSNVKASLFNAKQNLQQKIGQLQGEVNTSKDKINQFPTQEKIFRGIDRQQNLKEALYLFLLQKREENAINLAVALPKAKIINPAFTTGVVAPKTQQIQMGALALGLILPLGILFLIIATDTRIYSREDVLDVVHDASIAGEVPEHQKDHELVGQNDFTVYAESFRILSSNLKYVFKAKGIDQSPVVLVTSSVKGEGKTTVSMNLAISLSGNSKVLIIGADIRNPQLHRYEAKSNFGLTEYLMATDKPMQDFIVKAQTTENLDIMFSGAKAPNPNDLLDMQKFKDMIAEAKTHYDYVILDSAPIMLVSDTIHLIEVADTIVYVVKSGYTQKEMLEFVETFKSENKINNMTFVLNNVNPKHSRYGNKYGYGYYSDIKEPKSFLSKFFN